VGCGGVRAWCSVQGRLVEVIDDPSLTKVVILVNFQISIANAEPRTAFCISLLFPLTTHNKRSEVVWRGRLLLLSSPNIYLTMFRFKEAVFDRMEEESVNNETEDHHLSQMVSTSLTISQTKEITKIDTSAYRLPNKLHAGLYEKRRGCNLHVDTSIMAELLPDGTPPIRNNNGVPGFPDFPDSWCGEEGWATWQRIPPNAATNKTQRRQRAEDIQQAHQSMVLRHIKRQAVNVAGLSKRPPRTKAGYKPSTAKTKPHKLDRRRKIVKQLRHRREMASLRKNLKALTCK
jgi:hypothetical protein